MFFGLEEVDGAAYLEHKKKNIMAKRMRKGEKLENNEPTEEQLRQDESGKKKKEETPRKKKKDKRESTSNEENQSRKKNKKAKKDNEQKGTSNDQVKLNKKEVVDEDKKWATLSLHTLLVSALSELHFSSPTPIQTSAIPLIIEKNGKSGLSDVVGSAETGSGKTLAFGLPLLHTLLHQWNHWCNTRKPYSIILTPTRELAMQITSVLNDVCGKFRELRRVEVVNVIGGLSEHKQRRQLSGSGKPCHIIVATPGRLSDMLDVEEAQVLHDLSSLRYLVVDEADRMMEEGHFPELHKIFSRITDHEALATKGLCPIEEARKAREGVDFEEFGNHDRPSHEDEDDDGDGLEANQFVFDSFPTEEEIQQAREDPSSSMRLEERLADQSDSDDEGIQEQSTAVPAYVPKQRQTLLFSATAIGAHKSTRKSKSAAKPSKKHRRLLSLGLPDHICQLLETVGIQAETLLAQPSSAALEASGVPEEDNEGSKSSNSSKKRKRSEEDSALSSKALEASPALPATLEQLEVRVATEDKDMALYLFLLKNTGRTLIFVNSIKTARRVDGLLRALDINCRCLHAQLQQKQRIKALESFVSTPVGVLVATDVAARGLDLPKVQFVLHYDIARSPQVYIHRSGRTARAGARGTSLSIVAPEDTDHHRDICEALRTGSLSVLRGLDVSSAPVVSQRVKLAKKIFLQSFVVSQSCKERHWLEKVERDTGLQSDEQLWRDMSLDLDRAGRRQARDEGELKRRLEADRAELRRLLSEPYQEERRVNPRQKRPFVVVAK